MHIMNEDLADQHLPSLQSPVNMDICQYSYFPQQMATSLPLARELAISSLFQAFASTNSRWTLILWLPILCQRNQPKCFWTFIQSISQCLCWMVQASAALKACHPYTNWNRFAVNLITRPLIPCAEHHQLWHHLWNSSHHRYGRFPIKIPTMQECPKKKLARLCSVPLLSRS